MGIGAIPQRIQRQRTTGWRMPEGAIYVGRPTRWGNRWKIVPVQDHHFPFADAADVIDPATNSSLGRFTRHTPPGARTGAPYWATRNYEAELTHELIEEARAELAGHNLVCWCRLDQPCHADVLLRLANGAS